jgi:repressor LexA
VREAIQDRLRRQGYPPTVRELAQHLEVSSGTVQAHLRALERKGALKRHPFRARGLYLTPPEGRSGGEALRTVPIVGVVAAGAPLLAVENSEGAIPVHTAWAKGEELFFVRVQGESIMPTLGDGDYLLIRRQAAVEHEAIAVALSEGEVVVILGANGAGKTTTIRAVTGMIKGKGKVLVDGKSVLGKRPAPAMHHASRDKRKALNLEVDRNASNPGPNVAVHLGGP